MFLVFILVFTNIDGSEVLNASAIDENQCELVVKGEAQGGYYVAIGLGSPQQALNLLIDTGSSNFAVAASTEQINSSYRYNESQTFSATDKKLTIHYTEGSWDGFLAYDEVFLCSNPYCSVRALFACITSSKDIFYKNSSWQGVLGLAYPAIARPEKLVQPFFDSLVQNRNISKRFSLSLCGPYLYAKEQIATEGKLQLGYISHKLYEGEIMYTPIMKEWYYEIMITNLKVGNALLNIPCTEINNDKSIVDTGTTHLCLPLKVYNWVIQQMKILTTPHAANFSSKFWSGQALECFQDSQTAQLFPTITLSLYHSENRSFSLLISPELYLQKVSKHPDNSFCFKLSLSISERGTVIGATVLKGFYLVFDHKNKQLGFANSTCKKGVSKLAGVVLEPEYAREESFNCKFVNYSAKSIKILAYVMLIIAIVCTLPLLFMLVSWIWWNVVKHKFYSSETSNLVVDNF